MTIKALGVVAALAALGLACGPAWAQLSVQDIQYTTAAEGASPYDGDTVSCLGGVVTQIYMGSKPRLVLQDPNSPNGWGAIQVKGWTGYTAFDGIAVGDWVSVSTCLVEEYKGTTFLHYGFDGMASSFSIVSSGNTVPAPLAVSPADIAAPTETATDVWHVADHSAELYESMRICVLDVTVAAMDLGKAVDNYALADVGGDQCWASDYMNEDNTGFYHNLVSMGQDFDQDSGILEQYTALPDGIDWDYYQLLTTEIGDFVVPATLGDCDRDGDVDINDLSALAVNWGVTSGAEWADGDFDDDDDVDINDLSALAGNWSHGTAGGMSLDDAWASASIPEPATLALLAAGGMAAGRPGRRNLRR